MFKFPLKRHHHNNNNQTHHSKSASSRSNEGFIFIRCGHHSANDSSSNNNNSHNNSINNICTNNDRSIVNTNNNNNSYSNKNNNKYVAKSTVQTSWRPQLPLPKEVHLSNENIQRNHHLLQHQPEDDAIDDIQIIEESDMERFHLNSSSHKKDSSLNGSQLSNASHNGNGSNSKKWSFGRLFRRKKEVETESSSDEDRKAGFVPQSQKYNRNSNVSLSAGNTSTPHKKSKSTKSQNRASKSMGAGFDHIVMSPSSGQGIAQNVSNSSAMQQHVDNEFFLPVETVPAEETQEPYYQNNQQLQDQTKTARQQHLQQQQQRLHHSQQYLPHAPQTQQELMSRSAHSLDLRSAKAKQRSMAKLANGSPITKATARSSSEAEEEIISLNSSTFSKYRSDESIHSGGQGNANGQSRRSRAARNERYYKRLSRDGEVSHGQVPVMYAQQPTQRWKTQPVPLSIYQAPPQQHRQQAVAQQSQPQMRNASQNPQYSRLRNTSSLQHMAPYVQWGQTQQQQQQQQQPKNLQNSVNDSKRSISYDSHIHLQNIGGRQQSKPLPPPPPPRDPLRRVNVNGHGQDGSSGDLRPMSYAFDQTGVPVLPSSGLNGRCVSDDKIWAQQPHYQSIHSLNIPTNKGMPQQVSHSNRRFITRAERDAHPGKKSLPNGLEFHYVADATPRSRKPIHMLEQVGTYGNESNEATPSGILRTTKSGLPTSPTKVNATEFWKRLEGSSQNLNNTTTPIPTAAARGRDHQRSAVVESAMKPRSVSTSRVGELRAYPMPMYSEVYKPKKQATPLKSSVSPNGAADEVDAVVCGTLHIKPAQDNANNYVEIRNKDMNKAQSMPNHYQRRSGEIPTTPNKYEEYVNERREKHHNPLFDAPQPPQRKLSGVPNIPQLSFPRKKPANLEEAINELEAIYRSLGLSEETEPKKERVATPNDFEKYALAHADEYDDEDSPAGEPDPIRDDVAYRNIKLANLQHRTSEKQPLFGIPIGPIVPAAQTDYLHVTPKRKELPLYDECKAPDVIKDDLAVRALRKDPQEGTEKFQYPCGSLVKKNRATRTQSANIYALIQRDAAKPSGGDFHSYLELTKNIDRSGSLSDIHKTNTNDDIPTTLKLLQNLREQDSEQTQLKKPQHIPFRHPSQGGAICQLPEKLSLASKQQEEVKAQNPIPMPRKSLTPDPQSHSETHKMEEALNKIAQDAQESSIKLTKELNELRKEAFVTAVSRPKNLHTEEERKLENELQEIEKVSEAAKKCGKMLLDTLPDCQESEGGDSSKKSRKLHKEDTLIKAIDQVSEAANKVCEKILKDIVTTEPPVVVHEAVRVTQQPKEVSTKESSLIMPMLIKKLDPIQSTNIEAIARRCMRQLSDLADNHDYDNLNQPELAMASTCNMEQVTKDQTTNDLSSSNLTELRKPPKPKQQNLIEDIDQIMKECEDQARSSQENKEKQQPMRKQQTTIQAPGGSTTTTTASSFSSSSDCLAKSSSPSGSRQFSSSITSFNPYSSSDYIKSPSSDFHAPSTDPIKTFSTTSYDVQSTTSATPNLTTISTFSYSPSPPPLNLTPISNCSPTIASNTQRGRSSSPSQYNSSEELAMIFGIEEKSKTKKLHNNSGNNATTTPLPPPNSMPELLLAEQEKLTNAASPKPSSANSDHNECRSKTNDCLLLLIPNTCSTHNTNIASNPSSSSSPSSKLETIAESVKENIDTERLVKFSSNINKMYASKLNIVVDELLEDHQRNERSPQFDSLCSLEETSSNPDSGNVSLADYPLTGHNVNNSLHLNSTFNTRFEIRNCFRSEISIETKAKAKDEEQTKQEEFPPPPTEQELEDSLKESFAINGNSLRDELALKEKLYIDKTNHKLLGERIILAREVIMAEVKALEEQASKREKIEEKNKEEENNNKEEDNNLEVIMAERKALDEQASKRVKEEEENKEEDDNKLEVIMPELKALEEQASKRVKKEEANNLREIHKDNVVNRAFELKKENDELAISNIIDIKSIDELSDSNKSLNFDIKDLEDIEQDNIPQRKQSFIMETPQLEMNIMEERINYEINVNREDSGSESTTRELSLQNLAHNCYELNQALLQEEEEEERERKPISTCNENEASKTKVEQQDKSANELRLRLWQKPPTNNDNDDDDERPSTSSKSAATAVNVLGEIRPVVNSLTLLEHLVVACTLGLINTEDMFTLCLIIIGIIIVIAIALF